MGLATWIHGTVNRLVAQSLNVRSVASQDTATKLFSQLTENCGGVPLSVERASSGNPDYMSGWLLEIVNSVAIAYNDLPQGGLVVNGTERWSQGNPYKAD